MASMRRNVIRWFPLAVLGGSMAICPGCNDDDKQFDVIPLEGTIESIKASGDGTGEITVNYYSDKHGQEVTGTGLVTAETEITINGILASLAELRKGERIRGEVRVEKKGDTKVQTVLRIYVDRAVPKSAADG